MKVMIVCSGNMPDFSFEKNQSFIFDQVNVIKALNSNVTFSIFLIKGRGAFGYLKNLKNLKNEIDIEKPELIHAHYAFSGLLSNLQRKVKVITSFHGTDINVLRYRFLSKIVHYLSSYSIIVSPALYKKLNPINDYAIIPCGVDFDVFKPREMQLARQVLGLAAKKIYILFSSSFNNTVKNYPLAKKAKDLLHNKNLEIIEFKGYSRQESSLLFNAVDIALMTSFSEGSPQFIKEAMACNCPIVTTDVGDVQDVLDDTEGCYITSFDPEDVTMKLKMALDFNKRTIGRQKIQRFDNKIIAAEVLAVYKKILADQIGK
jgi:teichuronic acid biosynthesis glycosyltransferase TuaC